MSDESVIKLLEREWELEDGFFGRLRRGEFDRKAFGRLTAGLRCINFQDTSVINRRMVSLLWYVPIFMEWQKERVREVGGSVSDLEKAANEVQALLEQILGVP